MATIPFFKQRQLARRSTSDIGRLANQYKMAANAITSDYQTAFKDYQSKVNVQMAPFNEALAKYQGVDIPAFEAARAQYQKNLDAYNAQLKALEADPVIARTESVFVGRNWYGKKQYEDVTFYEAKPVPKFEEKAPVAPSAPTAPTIEAFDEGAFKAKREQLQSQFSREVGERRAARLGAVSRRSTRPMLQGA